MRSILTIQVTYNNDTTSLHGFELTDEERGMDIGEVAVAKCATLAGILKEQNPTMIEVAPLPVDTTIDNRDILDKIEALTNAQSNATDTETA